MYIVIETDTVNNGILYKSNIYMNLFDAKEKLLELYNDLRVSLEKQTEHDVECALSVSNGIGIISCTKNDDISSTCNNVTYKIEVIELLSEEENKKRLEYEKKQKELEELKNDPVLICKECGEFLQEVFCLDKGNRKMYFYFDNAMKEYEFDVDEYESEETIAYGCCNCDAVIDDEQWDMLSRIYKL